MYFVHQARPRVRRAGGAKGPIGPAEMVLELTHKIKDAASPSKCRRWSNAQMQWLGRMMVRQFLPATDFV